MKKILSLILCVLLTTNIFVPVCFASTTYLTDIDESYAKEAIINLNENNILSGYPDKTFKPTSYITRGEMAVLVDNLINYKYTAINPFKDLDNSFYTNSILKLNYAKIMLGNPNNEVKPKDYITKEETAALLCRAFQINTTENAHFISQFTDGDTISDWAKPYVSALVRNGYINPALKQFNTLNPKGFITREDFAYILNNIVNNFVNDAITTDILNKTYNGNTIISTNNITFNNCEFHGIIYISPNVDIETIIFNNSTATKIINLGNGTTSFYEDNYEESYKNILAEYTIPFDNTNENLCTNLNKCAKQIDGTIISSNRIFSFNNIVNNISELNGYKISSEFYNNGTEELVGGGICEISSLLFSLALHSGCEIISRTSHDSLPDYIAPGTDADVFYRGNNLEFRNTYMIPIKIKIDVNKTGIITAYFCTKTQVKAKNVDIFTYKNFDNIWHTEQYVDGILEYTATSVYNQ